MQSYEAKLPTQILSAIKSDSPSLATIQKENGTIVAVSMLMLILGDLIKFMNVGKSMNELQLSETAKLILQEFYFLKPEDLKIFFHRFKTGQTGQLFDRLDGQVIMFKLREYCEERIEVAERLSLESHKELTEAQKQERYFVKIGENYIHETPTEIIEVVLKDTATDYDFKEAIRVKNLLINEYTILDAKIVYSNKSEVGLIEYIKTTKPELANEIEKIGKPKEFTRKHTVEIAMIEAQGLSELETENAKRKLVYLEPLSQYEWDLRKEIYEKKTTQ